MVAKVIKPFTDVMGLFHKNGEVLTLTENGAKRYCSFVEEVKKNVKRKSSSDSKTKSATDE